MYTYFYMCHIHSCIHTQCCVFFSNCQPLSCLIYSKPCWWFFFKSNKCPTQYMRRQKFSYSSKACWCRLHNIFSRFWELQGRVRTCEKREVRARSIFSMFPLKIEFFSFPEGPRQQRHRAWQPPPDSSGPNLGKIALEDYAWRTESETLHLGNFRLTGW